MRKLKQMLLALALCFSLMSFFTVPVYAAEDGSGEVANGLTPEGYSYDSGNAIQDILNDARFEGAISSISKITGFVDIWFTRIISLVAFFIISAAMLKNACAGAYCANSKFWDKVADAHQKNEAISLASVKGFFQGGQGIMNASAGSLKDFLLGLVPNIKAFTDFDDADIEPKAYFMKAIPQMIACVVIGIFIYNGYYRDTASTVGDMGSVLIERTLGSVNPESVVNKFFNQTSWPKFPTEGDPSRQGKFELQVSKELKSLIASNYTDITSSSQKQTAVTNIANAARNASTAVTQYFQDTEDGYSYNAVNFKSYATASPGNGVVPISQTATPSAASEDATSSVTIITDEAGNANCRFIFNLAEIAGPSTSATTGNCTAVVTCSFKKVVKDEAAAESNITPPGVDPEDGSIKMTVNPAPIPVTSFGSYTVNNGKATIVNGTIPLSAWGIDTTFVNSDSGFTLDGQKSSSVNVDLNGANITIQNATFNITDGKINLGYIQSKDKTKKSAPLFITVQQ